MLPEALFTGAANQQYMATTDEGTGIEGPLLVDGVLEDRGYQRQLAEAALRTHTLVCLPTGLGKTAVSLLVTAVFPSPVGRQTSVCVRSAASASCRW